MNGNHFCTSSVSCFLQNRCDVRLNYTLTKSKRDEIWRFAQSFLSRATWLRWAILTLNRMWGSLCTMLQRYPLKSTSNPQHVCEICFECSRHLYRVKFLDMVPVSNGKAGTITEAICEVIATKVLPADICFRGRREGAAAMTGKK